MACPHNRYVYWDQEAELCRRMREDLLGRSKQGIWAHLGASGRIWAHLGASGRIWAHLGASGRIWAHLGCMLLLLATTNLQVRAPGLAAGIGLWRFGYEDHMAVVGLLYHAAIAFGTVNLFVHERRLMVLSLGLLFGPLAIGDLLHRGSSPLQYLGAGLAYVLYCHIQGKKLHQQYQQQISDRYGLSIAAYQDSLTGLPNRLYLNEVLDSCFEAAKIQAQAVALLYIDLDGFKQINDRYSHRIGDLFLHEAAQRMRRRARPACEPRLSPRL